MVELTRVRLINWHNFQDECIPFRMVTYLIGVNAVGKTTIMDAIRYCLTTNKDFNAAGNRRSGRTLQGSVHGKQREENRYLRPGHTVAYVGVEFLDHKKMTHFVIAVRVESESPTQDLRHVSQDWFITKPGTKLEDLRFLDKNNRPTKKERFKTSCQGIREAATQRDARGRICRILGIGDAESKLGKKFNEVFHMGTSLKDIPDIRSFIYTYILPEPEIRVEALQSDMRELERLEETLYEVKERAEMLKTIVEYGKQAADLQKQVDINEGVILLASAKKFQAEEERLQAQSEAANRELERLEPLRQEVMEKLNQAQERLQKAIQERDEDPEFIATKFYQEQKKDRENEYIKQVKRQQKWQDSMDRLGLLLKKLQTANVNVAIHMNPEQFLDWSPALQRTAIETLDVEIAGLKKELDQFLFQSKSDLNAIDREKKQVSMELQILRSGKMAFPEAAENLCRQINEELKNRGMEADAKILCQLLMMEDESWQSCAEAALGNRRFDIIVPPQHYHAAKAVFTAMGEQVGDIALVDTLNLERDSSRWGTPTIEMLASKIGSENHYARQYVNYLLHGIVCCESADELENHKRSVTRDLLRHQSYRLQRMKKPVLFIGAKARRNRIEFLESKNRNLQEKLTEQQKRLNTLDGLTNDCNSFIYGMHALTIKNNADAQEKCNQLNDELNGIRRKLQEFENNPLLRGLFDRIASCKSVVDTIQKEEESLRHDIWTQDKIVKDVQAQICNILSEAEAAVAAYEHFCLEYPELTDEVETRFADALRTRTPASIESSRSGQRSSFSSKRDNYVINTLVPQQQKYNAKYADYPTGLEAMERYKDAYNSLIHVELERSMENLRKAQLRCKERFRKEILFRMKDDILNAKSQFRDLDKVMSELTYGEEKYHFVITDPKDKELLAFNQIIQDKNNVQITEEDSLFTQEAMSQSAYEAQVDELMAKILADVNDAVQDRSRGKKNASDQLSKYVDYRTYLDYDIVVENTVTGMKVPLSQVSGDNSGGENQAPFYVAICASLLQIYRQSPNSIKLVMLDEAFNNMTSDRIEPMMRMFRALNMQLVLISTVEKCSAIYPYCDIVYSIVKTGTRAMFAPFEKLYEGVS